MFFFHSTTKLANKTTGECGRCVPQGRNAAVARRGCFAYMKNMVRYAQDGIGGAE